MIINHKQVALRNARVNDIDAQELKKCLMELGYFPEANIFPPIYEITCSSRGNTSKAEAEAINLFVTKTHQKWRDFKLLKPENYM